MQVTIQTKIVENTLFLENTAKEISKIRGKLLKDLLNGKKVGVVKTQYCAEYNILARQFNSLRCEVEGLIKSTKECQKRDIKSTKNRLKSLKKSIYSLQKQIKKSSEKSRKQEQEKPLDKSKICFSIHHKKRKLARLEAKIERLENNKPAICLGGKKLFKAQYNLEENGYENHQQWKQAFQDKRTNRIFYLGSGDETFGNQNCQLLAGGRLQIRVLPELEKTYGKYVIVPIEFTYGKEIVHNAIKNKQAISYRFVRKNDKWYLFLTTKRPKVEKITKRTLGAIGVDLNKAHLAIGEINRHGNVIKYKRINNPIQDRRKDQVIAMFGEVVKEIVLYAKKQGKPIVIEELDFEKKKASLEGMPKKYRRMINYFAYSTFHQMIHSRATREGVEIIEVKAAFSSIIGKYKYERQLGISTHLAASIVLARRGLRFSERLPTRTARFLAEHRNRHVWGKWRMFSKAVSNRDSGVEFVSRHQSCETLVASTPYRSEILRR